MAPLCHHHFTCKVVVSAIIASALAVAIVIMIESLFSRAAISNALTRRLTIESTRDCASAAVLSTAQDARLHKRINPGIKYLKQLFMLQMRKIKGIEGVANKKPPHQQRWFFVFIIMLAKLSCFWFCTTGRFRHQLFQLFRQLIAWVDGGDLVYVRLGLRFIVLVIVYKRTVAVNLQQVILFI